MRQTFHITDTSDPKAKAFLEYIKTLDFVTVSEKTDEIPYVQQEEVNRRVQLVQEGEMKTRSWTEAKKDIFKK